MNSPAFTETCPTSALCAQCGIPLDAKYFDESRVEVAPEFGSTVELARFDLPPHYCGVLEYFSQFTDAYAVDNRRIKTPGLEWTIVVNGRPLDPYLGFERIVNPWGEGSFPVFIRLDDSAMVQFLVAGVQVKEEDKPDAVPKVNKIGGRILGRYWYNAGYGDVVRHGG